MDEDDGFVFRQDDVRFAGQILDVQAKPITHPMQQTPDDELRGSIFPADSAHVPGASFGCESVAHAAQLKQLSEGQ